MNLDTPQPSHNNVAGTDYFGKADLWSGGHVTLHATGTHLESVRLIVQVSSGPGASGEWSDILEGVSGKAVSSFIGHCFVRVKVIGLGDIPNSDIVSTDTRLSARLFT